MKALFTFAIVFLILVGIGMLGVMALGEPSFMNEWRDQASSEEARPQEATARAVNKHVIGGFSTTKHFIYGNDIAGIPDFCANEVIPTSNCGGVKRIVSEQGNTYRIMQIGKQCWMIDPLREKPASVDFWYGSPPGSDVERDGYLYSWQAASLGGNHSVDDDICPEGWRLPSECELRLYDRSILDLSNDPLSRTFPGMKGGADNYTAPGIKATFTSSSTARYIFDEPSSEPSYVKFLCFGDQDGCNVHCLKETSDAI